MGVGAGLYMCDVVKSSRSLSHLLMSSCYHCTAYIVYFHCSHVRLLRVTLNINQIQQLTVELEAEVTVLAANRAGDGMLVPDLIVITRFVPQDHLGPWTLSGPLHVQNESGILADDQEILAFDWHRWTRTTNEVRQYHWHVSDLSHRLSHCAGARTCLTADP